MITLKGVFVLFFILLGIPAGVLICRFIKKGEYIFMGIMIFSTAKLVDLNLVSYEWYRGTSRGFQFALNDLAAWILLAWILITAKQRKIIWIPKGAALYSLYFIFSAISMINAPKPLFSLFELWKQMRIFIYYWVVVNWFRDEKQYRFLIAILIAITFYIFEEVLRQKYIMHIWQTKGTFPHQNSMAMYMALISTILFSLLLNETGKRMTYLYLLSVLVSALCVVFSLSRGTLFCLGIDFAILILFALKRGISAKKIRMLAIILILSIPLGVKVSDSIKKRIQTAPEESKLTRIYLAQAAYNMAKDKTFGIGLNNFGIVINPPYRYGDVIPDSGESPRGLVESVYLNIMAETGFHNLAVYLLLMLHFFYITLKLSFERQTSFYTPFAVGLLAGSVGLHFQGTLEWVMKQPQNLYLFFLLNGAIVAFYTLKQNRRPEDNFN